MPKPFIKWAGGKRQLIKKIKENMPKSYNSYFEPFIGGGALYFELKPQRAFINDYNSELTNLYSVVKHKPRELIEDLKLHKNTAEYYYKLRRLDREPNYKELPEHKRASRFIYLNKTGFNGLYRVNKAGENNVPFGRYKNPDIVNQENILKCSLLLNNTTITTGDFTLIKEHIKKGDFIYLDPPYVPISTTASFTAYTKAGFTQEDQLRLKELCDFINEAEGYFLLSNSYT
ncbi:MAG: hypothetical protein QG567_2134, partial [Campylobacterota bacterium]|nr:hypothetical protein [Campylobacterota bacterium]